MAKITFIICTYIYIDRGLCDELEITDEDKQKKFADSVAKNLITYSQYNFILKNIQYNRDKLPKIIKELNEMEKPVVLITNQDIEYVLCVSVLWFRRMNMIT